MVREVSWKDALLGSEVDDSLVENDEVGVEFSKNRGCLVDGQGVEVIGGPEKNPDRFGIPRSIRVTQISIRASEPLAEGQNDAEPSDDAANSVERCQPIEKFRKGQRSENREGGEIEDEGQGEG